VESGEWRVESGAKDYSSRPIAENLIPSQAEPVEARLMKSDGN